MKHINKAIDRGIGSFIVSVLLMSASLTTQATISSTYENQKASWDQHQAMREKTPYKGLSWRNVGPVVQGGRAVDVIRPADQPHVIYAAYASGGVWKSTNNGHSFMPMTDHLPSQIVGSLVVDPNDSNVLWLGTGENNSSRSSYGGMGVYKSTDAGQSWQYKGLGDSDRIGRIYVDPNDSNRIYVAALGKLYSKGGQRGLYRSIDGGTNWETLINGSDYTGFIDVTGSPNGDLYASAWDRSRSAWNFVEGGTGSAVYKSSDNGDTWQQLTQGLPQDKYTGRIGLSVSVSHPETIYVSVDNQTPLPESEWDLGDSAVTVKRLNRMDKDTFLLQDEKAIESFLRGNNFPPEMTAKKVIEQIENDETTPQQLVEKIADGNDNLFNVDIKSLEIYRSDNGGEHFYRTHEEDLQNVVFSYGYYFGQVKVDPQDVDTVYATGVPFIKSTDGGKTWASAWDSNMHADLQAIWVDPNHSNHLMVGNDGGVDESFDGGQSWRKIDHQPVGQFYTIAVDMAEPYNIYGGLQDNGTLKGSSKNIWHNNQFRGDDWERIFGGDGMHVNIDDEDKLTYVGFQFGNSFRLSS
ncbi:MAG: WD40/YVTN/BNR-like repeat-containing protein, partial [Marinicella sp.]